MVREDGATKLADFGIASVQGDPRLTATGLVVGSPAYMAPEQVEAQAVSPATDLWALGATLWFAVEGQPPFGGGEFQTLSAIVNGQPRRPERLGPLTPVLARLLVKDPAGRATPAQLRPLLRQVAEGAGGAAWTTGDRALRHRATLPHRGTWPQAAGVPARPATPPWSAARSSGAARDAHRWSEAGVTSPRAIRRRCPAGCGAARRTLARPVAGRRRGGAAAAAAGPAGAAAG